jgi:hypothetical protein
LSYHTNIFSACVHRQIVSNAELSTALAAQRSSSECAASGAPTTLLSPRQADNFFFPSEAQAFLHAVACSACFLSSSPHQVLAVLAVLALFVVGADVRTMALLALVALFVVGADDRTTALLAGLALFVVGADVRTIQ